MTSKRFKVSIIYFVVVILTLLLRVASALDIYSALGIDDADAFWSCMVQIVIFGVVPFCMYLFMVAGREDKFLPYFAKKESNEYNDEVEQVFEDKELAPPALNEEKACLDNSMVQPCAQESNNCKKPAFVLKSLFADFGFKKVSLKNSLRTIVLAVCMIVIGAGVSMIWQIVLSLVGYTRIPSDTDYSSIGILFKELFLVAVLPGFFEEFSHRGLLGAGYKECGWKFVIVSALLFSLMHQNIVQTGYTFVDGIAMALVMYYTGSIFPSIFMHFLNNAWSVYLGYVDQNGGVFGFINTIGDWLYSSIGGLLVCIIVVLLCGMLAVVMLWLMRRDAVKSGRIDDIPFKSTSALPLKYDLMFLLTVAVGVIATVFSLVWGIMR